MSVPPNEYPQQRFVRLRHGKAEHTNVTTTFTGVEATAALAVEGHGLLDAIASADPDRAQLVRGRLHQLMTHDHAVMTWLEASPDNVTLFAHDPVAALRQAIPDLPADFFEGWGTLPPSS